MGSYGFQEYLHRDLLYCRVKETRYGVRENKTGVLLEVETIVRQRSLEKSWRVPPGVFSRRRWPGRTWTTVCVRVRLTLFGEIDHTFTVVGYRGSRFSAETIREKENEGRFTGELPWEITRKFLLKLRPSYWTKRGRVREWSLPNLVKDPMISRHHGKRRVPVGTRMAKPPVTERYCLVEDRVDGQPGSSSNLSGNIFFKGLTIRTTLGPRTRCKIRSVTPVSPLLLSETRTGTPRMSDYPLFL